MLTLLYAVGWTHFLFYFLFSRGNSTKRKPTQEGGTQTSCNPPMLARPFISLRAFRVSMTSIREIGAASSYQRPAFPAYERVNFPLVPSPNPSLRGPAAATRTRICLAGSGIVEVHGCGEKGMTQRSVLEAVCSSIVRCSAAWRGD